MTGPVARPETQPDGRSSRLRRASIGVAAVALFAAGGTTTIAVAAPTPAPDSTIGGVDEVTLAEVSETADKVAIMEVASRFEQAFDAGDFEAHYATWDGDDIVFESPYGTYTGKQAYAGFLTGFYDQVTPPGTRHLMTNFVIDVAPDGRTATMRSYLTVLTREGPQPGIGLPTAPGFLATSVFEDRLVERADGWKFTYRRLIVDQAPDAAAPAGGTGEQD